MTLITETLDTRRGHIGVARGGRGDGAAPVVYLHGLLSDMHSVPGRLDGDVQLFHSRLAERFDVIAPACPGYPASHEAIACMDDMHDLLLTYSDLFDRLGLDRVRLVGLSLGGWIAAEFATWFPQRVERLVLVNALGLSVDGGEHNQYFFPACSPNPVSGYSELRQMLFADPESEVAKKLLPDKPDEEYAQVIRYANLGAARLGWTPQFFWNPRLAGRLYRVQAPTLVVWGDDDRMAPLANGEAYRAAIAGAQLVRLQGGHALNVERPAELADAVARFLT